MNTSKFKCPLFYNRIKSCFPVFDKKSQKTAASRKKLTPYSQPLSRCRATRETTTHAHCVLPSTARETGATLQDTAVCWKCPADLHRLTTWSLRDAGQSLVSESKDQMEKASPRWCDGKDSWRIVNQHRLWAKGNKRGCPREETFGQHHKDSRWRLFHGLLL